METQIHTSEPAPPVPSTKLSSQDVRSVAGKLEGFAHDLPEQEQAVLGWILQRAESCSDNDLAASAAMNDELSAANPMSRQLARSVGLADTNIDDITVEIVWTFRF